jgi:hypothetical protein
VVEAGDRQYSTYYEAVASADYMNIVSSEAANSTQLSRQVSWYMYICMYVLNSLYLHYYLY